MLCLHSTINTEAHLSRIIYTLASGGASPLFMAGHRQFIIGKGSQNILIYNFIITTFDCQGICPGVAPPLTLQHSIYCLTVLFLQPELLKLYTTAIQLVGCGGLTIGL